ncbi:MAG: hypothetical protein WBH20_12665, partial [Oceanisphaera sp.]|uniref:hypothetical protein n=1 Tax=Oceanisphaera sp. TaxID=1929979 RepID=UPI003C713177
TEDERGECHQANEKILLLLVSTSIIQADLRGYLSNKNEGISKPYKGINWAAYIAVFAGVPVALYFSNVSFYASLLPSAIVYYLLMKNKMVGSERFSQ